MNIKSAADLPEWFDLEKYKGCAEFGAVEWYACIKERAHVAHVVSCLPPGESGSIRAKLGRMRAHPLAAASRKRDIVDALTSRRSVRTATWAELSRAAVLDRFSGSEQAPAWGAVGTDAESPVGELLMPGWLDREADGAVAIVDLAATDAVLLAEFKAWLASARASRPPQQSTRNRPAVDRWAGYGLLPYLDLAIWGLETDTEIPVDVLRDAIRPRHSDSEHIRKTVAPLARSLIADLSGLRAMAAAEVEEPTPLFLHIPETFEP